MSRIIKCGLIQAHNVAPTDAPIEEIKKANNENQMKMVEDAAKSRRADALFSGDFQHALFLRRTADALV